MREVGRYKPLRPTCGRSDEASPVGGSMRHLRWLECPTCGTVLSHGWYEGETPVVMSDQFRYCFRCGQSIDFSEYRAVRFTETLGDAVPR